MQKNKALFVAGIVFTIVAMVHLIRLVFQWEIIIDALVIPMWVSTLGLIIAGILAIWMFTARKS